MNNLVRVLLTLVVSLLSTILLCAICVGTIQLLRTLCKKLTRALNAQRPYVVEFSGNGARRLSYESSSDGRCDTNSLDRRDSADVEARHAPCRGDDALDPIWTDACNRENDEHGRNEVGNGTSSTPVQNGSGCSSGESRSIAGANGTEYGFNGKAMRMTSSSQSPATNCSKLNDVREKNDRNKKEMQYERAVEDDLTIINIWAADDGCNALQQLQSGPLGRKFKKGKTVMESSRKNVEEIRALELIQYTESPRVPGRKRNLGENNTNKEISTSGFPGDIPSLTVTDGDASPFLSCLEDTVSTDENTIAECLSPPRTPCTFIQNEVNNNESFSESLNYVSAEYDFSQPSFVEKRNDRETRIADKIPLNLFDCDRVVPSSDRHYPFRHEVEALSAISCPGSRVHFGTANHGRTRSASLSGGLSDECLQNLRSALDKSPQSSVVDFFHSNGFDATILVSCPSDVNQEHDGLRQSNASLASTLVSQEVRRARTDSNNSDYVAYNTRRLCPQHRYLSLDVNNLSEDPPEYNKLPPPTYIEAMLNDHILKQKKLLEKKKSSCIAIANSK